MLRFRTIFVVMLVCGFLLNPLCLYSSTRGIRVKSTKGQQLYLYKDYHALVLGVGNYDDWPDLPGAVRDAQEIAEKLKDYGFKVRLVLNPTSSQLESEFNNLAFKIGRKKDRAILIYFAGHGQTEELANQKKLGYIVPKDCPRIDVDPAGFVVKAMSMKTIEQYALRIRSKHVLMLFDSCFSGSVFSSVRSAPTAILEKVNKPVRQFITAGNEEEQVPDQSVFKTCFIDGIYGEADLNKDGYVTGSELGMYLDTNVINYSSGSQHPQYGKIRDPRLDKGDFVFVRVMRKGEPAIPLSSIQAEREQIEEELRKLRKEKEKVRQFKALQKERERLKTEKMQLEKEKRLAYIPKSKKETTSYVPKTPVVPYTGNPIKLTYANFPPVPTFPCVQMERWKKEVERRTGGKVLISTYPGGTLLKAKTMMDGVIAGVADIGNLCMAYQPGRFLITNAIALPLDIPSAKVGSLTLWDLYKKYKPKSFAKVKILAMFTTAPSNIMSKMPIRNLSDIRGVPIRASGGAAQVLKAWGANRVGMSMPETPEALQRGVVKGIYSSLEIMKDFKFAELCKYVTMTQTPVYPFAVVMNMDKWNSLPKDVQRVMDDMGREHSLWTGNYVDAQVKESLSWSKNNEDVKVFKLSSQEKAKWDKLTEPITLNWIKSRNAKGIPAKAIILDIRAFRNGHLM
jgi:TRAP-type transport system periplasmic protein